VTVECVAFDDADVTYGLDGLAPQIKPVPAIYAVNLTQEIPIGEAIAEAT